MEDDLSPGHRPETVTRFLITQPGGVHLAAQQGLPRFAGEWNHAIGGIRCKRIFKYFRGNDKITESKALIIIEPLVGAAVVMSLEVVKIVGFILPAP